MADAPTPTPVEQLRRLIAAGLDFATALSAFGEVQAKDEPHLEAYIAGATDDDDLEVDSSHIVSPAASGGAWVLSWQFVSDAEAGIAQQGEAA